MRTLIVLPILMALAFAGCGGALAAEKGTLVVKSNDDVKMGLASDSGKKLTVKAGENSLPAGVYSAVALIVTKKETVTVNGNASEGPLWTLQGNNLAALQKIEVKPGETTTIEIGDPLVLKVAPTPMKDGVITLNLQVTGTAGEVYSALPTAKTATAVKAPEFKIVDDKGKELASGAFQFG
jgi:hypothetical protein